MTDAPSSAPVPPDWSVGAWSQQGLADNQGEEFARQVQHITPLKLFIRTLPGWCQQHGTSVSIAIEAAPGIDGVGIELSFGSSSLPVGAAADLVERMMQTSRLMELEEASAILREGGAPPEAVNAVVDLANSLAAELARQSGS